MGWYYEMWMKNKMGCPIRMGCKGDEKKKCIPKKDGVGWGWKKLVCPKRMGCQGDEKKKVYIPKKDGIGQGRTNGMIYKDGMRWGWKKLGVCQKGWCASGMKRNEVYPRKMGWNRMGWEETSSTFIHRWSFSTYSVAFVVIVVFTRSIRFCVRRGRRQRALAFGNSGSCRRKEPQAVLLGEGGSFVRKGILWGKLAEERTKASSVVGERIL